jgi:IS5 family transposase
MLKENPKSSGQEDLYRARLESIIDLGHELVKMMRLVEWSGLDSDLRPYYCADNGRPGEPIRLMAGLQLLKDMKGLSDEEVCEVWRENPYFQYFCGEEFFQHRLPVEPPSLSIFRKRIGKEGMERLLQETVRVGLKSCVTRPVRNCSKPPNVGTLKYARAMCVRANRRCFWPTNTWRHDR